MKKVIGISGVAVFAMTMFFNTNVKNNSKSSFSLASLISMNVAQAEEDGVAVVRKSGKSILCTGTGELICE